MALARPPFPRRLAGLAILAVLSVAEGRRARGREGGGRGGRGGFCTAGRVRCKGGSHGAPIVQAPLPVAPLLRGRRRSTAAAGDCAPMPVPMCVGSPKNVGTKKRTMTSRARLNGGACTQCAEAPVARKPVRHGLSAVGLAACLLLRRRRRRRRPSNGWQIANRRCLTLLRGDLR